MADIPVERKTGGLPGWLLPLLGLLILIPLLWFLMRGCSPAAVVNNNANANRVITTTTNTSSANRAMTNNSADTGVSITNASGANGANGMNGTNGANGVNGANGASGSSTTTTTTEGSGNGSSISVDNKGTATGERVTDVNIFGGTADKNSLNGRGVDLTKVKVNRVLSDRVFTVTSGSGEMFVMLDEKLDSGGGKESQIKMRQGQTVNIGGNFRRVPDANTQEERQNRDLNKTEYAQMKGQQVYLHAQSVADAK